MTTEITGILLIFVLAVAMAIPFGKYISRVYKGEKTFLDFMSPLENSFFKLSGINP